MTDALKTQIANNLDYVQQRIAKAAISSGRAAEAVHLVVVSKRMPFDLLSAAIEAGITCFGENYPEEGAEKRAFFAAHKGLSWHMIGHVQSRKARLVAENYDMLHSLDGLKLAQRISLCCEAVNRQLPVLLEVNVAGEASKSGFSALTEADWQALIPVFSAIAALPGLRIQGLMCMPPLFDDPNLVRPFFRKTCALQNFLASNLPQISWQELSMGTSADYTVAIEEGATMVRIGEAILGARPARLLTV